MRLAEQEATRRAHRPHLQAFVRKIQLALAVNRCLQEHRNRKLVETEKIHLAVEVGNVLSTSVSSATTDLTRRDSGLDLESILAAADDGSPTAPKIQLHEEPTIAAAWRFAFYLLLTGQLFHFDRLLDQYILKRYYTVRKLLKDDFDSCDSEQKQKWRRMGDVCVRLRSMFGIGWFFEWPGGRHPPNSTWPWTQMKPSLMVLWGVCWMFAPQYDELPDGRSLRRSNGSWSNPTDMLGFSDTASALPQHLFPAIDNRFGSSSPLPSGSSAYQDQQAFDFVPSEYADTVAGNVHLSWNPLTGHEEATPRSQGQPPGIQQSRAYNPAPTPATIPTSHCHETGMNVAFGNIQNINTANFSRQYPQKASTEDYFTAFSHTSHYNTATLQPCGSEAQGHGMAKEMQQTPQDSLPGMFMNSSAAFMPQAANRNAAPITDSTVPTQDYELKTASPPTSQRLLPQSSNPFDRSRYSPHSQSLSVRPRPPARESIMADTYSQYPEPDMENISAPYLDHVEQEYPNAIGRSEFDSGPAHHDDQPFDAPPSPDDNPYVAPDHDHDHTHAHTHAHTHDHDAAAAAAVAIAAATTDARLELPVEAKKENEVPSPGRSKPVPKPIRDPKKNDKGRYYCDRPDCTEDIKDFQRKCEWSKHMDKHERPYKCEAPGCEKLPGFTYSGGLLRHEREVHNKHGGPRKQLNCPHATCKRHTGKGFSRQENLNEHLRRVHTDSGSAANGDETESETVDIHNGKRKRVRGDTDLREEMKRLRQENEELRQKAEFQTAQTADVLKQLSQLQASISRLPAAQLQASTQPLLGHLEG